MALAIAAQVAIAKADPLGDCNQARNLEARVRGCSEIIDGRRFSMDQRAVAYRNRGQARSDAGARDQAIADFSEAIQLDANDSTAYVGRGHVFLAKRDIDAALADYSAALRLAPVSTSVLLGRGHAHVVRGDIDAAIIDFTEAILLNPKSASAYNHRGVAWRRKGNSERAIQDYTTAVVLNPIYALAYNNRGYAYEANGRTADAIADFNRALLLDSSLVGAAEGLKRLRATGSLLEASESAVREGRVLVATNCATCHAVGLSGGSPNSKAPEFRALGERHPVMALREPLLRGITAPHDEMPKFNFGSGDMERIIAYINDLNRVSAR